MSEEKKSKVLSFYLRYEDPKLLHHKIRLVERAIVDICGEIHGLALLLGDEEPSYFYALDEINKGLKIRLSSILGDLKRKYLNALVQKEIMEGRG
jgi:hypothetical protein